ncbi:putative amidoligase domain-containing protein [Paenibacillus sp. FSL H3-0333]|uniref:putative amidoligase domain-containing protein n=1 Tax=Paenibacillus sp. FSL H3-0333 TaxID=2921373 RepID=UPI0030FA4BCA
MNEGLNVFRQLAPEQIERRLRRCGIEADSISIGRGSRRQDTRDTQNHSDGQDPASYRQHYRVFIFNLAVLDCLPLGAGAAMGGLGAGWLGGGGSGRGRVGEQVEYGSGGVGVGGQEEKGSGRVGVGGQGEYGNGGVGFGVQEENGSGRVGVGRQEEYGNGGGVAGGQGEYGSGDQGAGGQEEDGSGRRGVGRQGGNERDGEGAGEQEEYERGGPGVEEREEYGSGRVGVGRQGEYRSGGDEFGSLGGGGRELRGAAGVLRTTAVRALYSLGLDSGEVELRAMGGRRYMVTGITPVLPDPAGALPEPYRSASAALARMLDGEQPGRPGLLMGMDPEFLLLRESSGRVVPASRYLPMDGVAGCDAGPPGTRGVFPVAELRPAPRGEPRALLAQLMSAAREADRLIADRSLCWRAGGMPLRGWALGGHLHFSGVTLCAPLLRALDNYLALPLFLLEDIRAAARRPRYGVLGDFRPQPHGGFEYRTLPSFLVSPVIAKGAVCLAHLIVSHYEDLPLRPLDREDLHAAFYSGGKSPLRTAWPPLEAQLRALGGYAAAARWIDPLLRAIAEQQSWDESRDIRGSWVRSAPPDSGALPSGRADAYQ